MSTTAEFSAAIEAADFATTDVDVCFKGSLQAAWERAESEVIAAQALYESAVERGDPSAAPAAAVERAAEAFRAAEKAIAAASVTFTMTGVGEDVWQAVLMRNPPRAGNQLDSFMGYDTAGGLSDIIKSTCLSPKLSDAQWEQAFTKMTDAQFRRLGEAAAELNRGADGGVPFSSAALEAMRAYDETSRAQKLSASAPADFGDGSPAPTIPASGTSPAAT